MKKHNFYVNDKGFLNPFADEDGYTDGLGDAPTGELRIIENFWSSPDYFRGDLSFVIVSDEQAAREDAERAARKAAAKRKVARELPAMPTLDRPYPKPQYAQEEAMMLRDSAASDPA